MYHIYKSSDTTDDFRYIFKRVTLVFQKLKKGTAFYSNDAERIKVWFTYDPKDTIKLIEKAPNLVDKKDFRYEVIMED